MHYLHTFVRFNSERNMAAYRESTGVESAQSFALFSQQFPEGRRKFHSFTPKEHGRHSTLQLLTKHFGYKATVVLKMTSKASPQTIKKPRAPHLDNVQPRVYNLLMTHCLPA